MSKKPSERYMVPWRGELEYRIEVLENRLTSKKPLTFFVDECNNIPCNAAEEALKQSVERLVAYFEKRSRENQKRAEVLDKKASNFEDLDTHFQNSRSSYYFSGKADSYKRAAEKVRELLGEPKPATPKEAFNPEKWIVEARYGGDWQSSGDVPQEFSSKQDAIQGMTEATKRFASRIERRTRRVG